MTPEQLQVEVIRDMINNHPEEERIHVEHAIVAIKAVLVLAGPAAGLALAYIGAEWTLTA